MGKLNDPVCATVGNNTGNPSCIIVPKNIKGGILIPKATALTSANVLTSAACIAAIQTLTLGLPAARAYPFGPFIDIADNSEEAVFATSNYGVKEFVREGLVGWKFAINAGGIKLQNALRSFNHTKAHSMLFYDKDNVLYGVDDGSGGMKGFSLEEFYAHPWKAPDGSNPAKFFVEFMFSNTKELNEDLVFIKLDSQIENVIKGNIDVELELVSQTSTKAVIRVWTKSAKVNLYAAYSTALASLGVWTVTTGGASVTPTGVSAIAATEAFEFTLTTPTGAHLFNLAVPSVLAAANIGGAPDNGYESTGALTVTFS